MGRRRENIYQRTLKDGTVRYDVMLTYKDPLTGRRQQKMRTYNTLAKAKAALAENEHNRTIGHSAAPSDVTLGEFMQTWLDHQAAFCRDSTIAVYRQTVELHVIPRLGQVRLCDLTSASLEAHYAVLRKEGLGAYAIKDTHGRIAQALRYARRHHLIIANPADDVSVPRPKRHEFTAWDDAEIARFLDASKNSYYGPIWALAVMTGMRRGELLGLPWSDIDTENGLIHVRQQLANVAGRLMVHIPKSGKTRRIAVGRNVLTMLREHRARQLEWRVRAGSAWVDTGLVFTTHHGTHLGLQGTLTDFRRCADVAGVRPIRIHDLRHTHASWLLRHGRTIKQVSERLGHAQTSMTLNTYAHVMPDEHRETADLIDRQMAL